MFPNMQVDKIQAGSLIRHPFTGDQRAEIQQQLDDAAIYAAATGPMTNAEFREFMIALVQPIV